MFARLLCSVLLINGLAFGDWSEPTLLSNNANDNVSLAIDGQGTHVAVFVKQLYGKLWVASSRKTASDNWSKPFSLSKKINERQYDGIYCQVIMDVDGNAFAVWSAPQGKNHILQGAILPTGSTTWQPLADYTVPPIEGSPYFQLGVDASGNVMAAWQSGSTMLSLLLKKGSTNWLQLPAVKGGYNMYNMSFKVAPDGTAWLLWTWGSSTLDSGNLSTASYSPTTNTWSKPQRLASPEHNCNVPVLALDPGGNPLVVWQKRTQSICFEGLYYNPNTATWESTDFSAVTGIVNDFPISLNIDALGKAVLIYQPDGWHLTATTLPVGARVWSAPVQLSPDPTSGNWINQIDAAGNRILTWVTYKKNQLGAAVLPLGQEQWSTWNLPSHVTSSWPLGDAQISGNTATILYRPKGNKLFSVTGTNLFTEAKH